MREHQPGVVVDFESVPKSARRISQHFIHDLAAALHATNLKLMVALPAADWSYDYKYFAAQADAIILMNYDFHWPTSDAGPDRSAGLVRAQHRQHDQACARRKKCDGHRELRLRLAGKIQERSASRGAGRDVPAGRGDGRGIANRTSPSIPTRSIRTIPTTTNKNQIHNVWMLDGVTAYNELRAAERAGVRGTALWRLGMEDPSIWSIWDATHPDDAIRAQARGNSAGLRLDSRRRRRYLADHRDAAKRPAHFRLRRGQRHHRRRKLSKLSAFLAHRADGRGAAESRADL